MQKGIERILYDVYKQNILIYNLLPVTGGCIHKATKVETSVGSFFIKYNEKLEKDSLVFQTEAQGLELLKNTEVINVPEVHAVGCVENLHYLILEYVEPSVRKQDYWKDFGERLAALHNKSNDRYGLSFNNYIGWLPQENHYHLHWIDFFIQERLEPQISRAFNEGKLTLATRLNFQRLYSKLPDILKEEKPSLLHGDLWSGNVLVNHTGNACLIDPAVYYGHREMELAFTKLFGGFEDDFYDAYTSHYPLEKGFKDRFDIYNLYPLLVHVNMFGTGYLKSVLHTLHRFVK